MLCKYFLSVCDLLFFSFNSIFWWVDIINFYEDLFIFLLYVMHFMSSQKNFPYPKVIRIFSYVVFQFCCFSIYIYFPFWMNYCMWWRCLFFSKHIQLFLYSLQGLFFSPMDPLRVSVEDQLSIYVWVLFSFSPVCFIEP